MSIVKIVQPPTSQKSILGSLESQEVRKIKIHIANHQIVLDAAENREDLPEVTTKALII